MNGAQLLDKIIGLPVSTPVCDAAEAIYWPRHHDAWFESRRMQWIYGPLEMAHLYEANDAWNMVDVPAMLLWLAEASGVEEHILKKAIKRAVSLNNPRARCNAIRKAIPWRIIERNLTKEKTP